ncbi:MAG: GNAT family N-acetyltransferase [Thermotogota bacterium]
MNYLDVKIETERLILKPISMKDKQDIFENFTEDLTKYMYPTAPKEIYEVENFINSSLKGLRENSNLQMVIRKKDNNEFIGNAGLHNTNSEIPELGIWIKKDAFGKGFGKEAITAITEWAKSNLKVKYITYPVDKDNIPSKKIPLSLNGKFIKEYEEKTPDGRILNIEEYYIEMPSH